MARKKKEKAPTTKQYTGTVASVEDGISALEELASEMREMVDNVSGTGLENTDVNQRRAEAADALESLPSMPDIDEPLLELEINWTETLGKKSWGRIHLSRASRRDNALAPMYAAVDRLQAFVDEEQAKPWAERRQELIDSAEQAGEDIQSIIDDAEAVEFPGMYG